MIEREGQPFCVFKQSFSRTKTEQDRTKTVCFRVSGNQIIEMTKFDSIDWEGAKIPEKERVIMDFHPGPNDSSDVWFLTPHGLGRLSEGKTEYWAEPFKSVPKDAYLSKIETYGTDGLVIFSHNDDSKRDVFLMTRSK